MFSKLSQLSQNLGEELSRINEEVAASRRNQLKKSRDSERDTKFLNIKTPDPEALQQPGHEVNEGAETETDATESKGQVVPNTNIHFNDLPMEIRARLKKFAKYEQKYPLLLDAYKTEKAKSEIVHAFESTLQEVTPLQTIGEIEQFKDFISNMTQKAKLMDEELRAKTGELNGLKNEVTEMKEKLKAVQGEMKAKSALAEESAMKADQLSVDLERVVSELENLKKEREEIVTERDEATKERDESTRERDIILEEVKSNKNQELLEEYKSELEEAKNALALRTEEIENLNLKLESEKSAKLSLEGVADERDGLKAKLEAQTTSFQEELDQLSQERDRLNSQLTIGEKSQIEIEQEKNELKSQYNSEIKSSLSKLESVIKERNELQQQLESQESLTFEVDKLSKERDELRMQLDREKENSAKASITPQNFEVKTKVESNKNIEAPLSEELRQVTRERDELKAQLLLIQKNPGPSKKTNEGNRNLERNGEKKSHDQNGADDDLIERKGESGTDDSKDNQLKLIEQSTTITMLNEEIENLKDMLRDVGDDLVVAKDKLSQVSAVDEKKQHALERELESSKLKLAEIEKDYNDDRVDLKNELKLVTEEKENLEHENETLSQSLTELEKLKQEVKEKAQAVQNYESKYSTLSDELSLVLSKRDELEKDKESFRLKLKDLEQKNSETEQQEESQRTGTAEMEEELQTLKRELEASSQRIEDYKQKQLELDDEISLVRSQKDELQKTITSLQEDLGKEKENVKLLRENIIAEEKAKNSQKLAENVAQLDKFKKQEISLKLEIANLENLNAEKGSKIKSLEEHITYLNTERQSNYDENQKLISHTNEKWKQDYTELVIKLNKCQSENNRLTKELNEYKDKLKDMNTSKLNSSETIESIRRQCEELKMMNNEYSLKIESLHEELSSSSSILQERSREMNTIRKLLADTESKCDERIKQLKARIDRLEEEKETTSHESSVQARKLSKTIDQLKKGKNELSVQLEQCKLELEHLKSVPSRVDVDNKNGASNENSDENQSDIESGIIEQLRNSLKGYEEQLKQYQDSNVLLKKVNEEQLLKFERLHSNFKIVSKQYRMLKDQKDEVNTRSRNNSVISSTSAGSDENERDKVAYIKNVLLGFLEHKDQRAMLFPVVKMLLMLDDDEERRLASSLK
ncbi:Vesicular transport protein [Komagataella phaffii CBS 7435]|uniref:Vesicular transport protein n=1 Tax=Komagataella phaffii (strain ATCC 76273 / CBS 7435 / CECT 11047 / NRRL Y-11430 / Wegner 21-1) TaxID=981350 RepID=F2QN57_KOMPC|nr:GQ67_02080T0 [Komagataella phaffii]AOA65455.1 GQ68_02095T0 [Komagataella phaffii GS115]CAH2446747.1 Vesicular transport protein [Komagataella phaffii CBS 7435]CCA37012.1 Vesicular transport protein [Komagataella phaffii CBS 7435]